MDLIFSENEKETSSGYALSGGNPALKDLAVPAGLFFLQKTLQNQSSNYFPTKNQILLNDIYITLLMKIVSKFFF